MNTHHTAVEYVELLHSAESVNQHVHEADFIVKAHQQGQAIWVQRDAFWLFWKSLVELQNTVQKKKKTLFLFCLSFLLIFHKIKFEQDDV